MLAFSRGQKSRLILHNGEFSFGTQGYILILWFYCDERMIDSQILIKRISKVPDFENRFKLSHQISNSKHKSYCQMLKIRLNHLSRPNSVFFGQSTGFNFKYVFKWMIFFVWCQGVFLVSELMFGINFTFTAFIQLCIVSSLYSYKSHRIS